jgi:glucokinase
LLLNIFSLKILKVLLKLLHSAPDTNFDFERMNLFSDDRIVMTLDAGGTNFVFSAIMSGEIVVEPIRFDSEGDNLVKSLTNIVSGFQCVLDRLYKAPVAISFAFPGPADYPNGIIGDLVNLPAYKGGVALGALLEEKFGMPVFINNDGDLFAYGEAIGGILPEINMKLEKAGSPKRYKNLLGITLGTGFGGGIVTNGRLYLGDNAMAAEVYAFRNKLHPNWCAEDGISIRAIKSFYQEYSGDQQSAALTPKDIFDIAKGNYPGNQKAAKLAFEKMGVVLGDVLAQLVTTLDGIVVIGGGLSGASELFIPSVLSEMNGYYELPDGEIIPRLIQKVVNLDLHEGMNALINQKTIEIEVPGSRKKVNYNPEPIVGVGVTRIGANRAVSLGAVAYALSALDSR